MKLKTIAFTVGTAVALCAPWQQSFAADEASGHATSMEKMFVKKAADGGMTEVELGHLAAEKGASDAVKDFGNQMVTDHSKINDNLKEVAGKMNVQLPSTISKKHKMVMDKLTGLSGAAFDTAYVKEMVKDHKMDVAEFEKADKEVKNPDLKSFIDDSLPTLKDHLAKIEKFDQAK
ncbi:MAG TPA: DUF4142 domain-containing protein [Chthoniobacterales bacterium]|jgi:putative membrane protein